MNNRMTSQELKKLQQDLFEAHKQIENPEWSKAVRDAHYQLTPLISYKKRLEEEATPKPRPPLLRLDDGRVIDKAAKMNGSALIDKDNSVYIVVDRKEITMKDYNGYDEYWWAHTVRPATEEETKQALTPMTDEERRVFWNDFLDKTDYIGS